MKLGQILRISVALALIFAAGIITGRYTAPRPPIPVGGNRGQVTSDAILMHVTAELGLDAGQKGKMKTIIEDLCEQMSVVPFATPERRDIFRKGVPRMRALMRPDQYAAFDRYVDMTEKHYARMIRRRREMMQQPQDPGR